MLDDSCPRGKTALWVFAGILLICLAFMPPSPYSIDGNSTIAAAQSVILDHDFTVPHELGRAGRDGQIYSPFYLLLTVLAIPFVALGIAAANLAHLPVDYASKAAAMIVSSLIAAGSAAVVALLTVRLGGSRRTSVLAAIAYTFGTVSLAYTGDFFSDPLLGLVTVTALYYAFGGSPRDATMSAVLAMLAVAAKPFGIVVGPVLSIYMLATRRNWTDALKPLAGALLGVALFLAYNALRWGWFRSSPYPPMGVQYMPEALAGFILSPGKGLAVFCPAVVAATACFLPALRSKKRVEALAIAAIAISYLLAYSTFSEWYSFWCWGPRYLIPALPGLFGLVAFTNRRISQWLVALTVMGIVITAPTLVSYPDRYFVEARDKTSVRQLVWSPLHSAALQQWGIARRTVQDALETDVRHLLADAGKRSDKLQDQQILHIVAVWWWMLPVVGIPWWVGLSVCCIMAVSGVLLLTRAICQVVSDGTGEYCELKPWSSNQRPPP